MQSSVPVHGVVHELSCYVSVHIRSPHAGYVLRQRIFFLSPNKRKKEKKNVDDFAQDLITMLVVKL